MCLYALHNWVLLSFWILGLASVVAVCGVARVPSTTDCERLARDTSSARVFAGLPGSLDPRILYCFCHVGLTTCAKVSQTQSDFFMAIRFLVGLRPQLLLTD